MGTAAQTQFKFAFSCTIGTKREAREPSFGPVAEIPMNFSKVGWHDSSAPLDGVRCIRVCIDREKPHHPCIGVVLTYSEPPHQEAIGQWRFDRDIEEILVEGPIYICTVTTGTGSYVTNITSEKPPIESG